MQNSLNKLGIDIIPKYFRIYFINNYPISKLILLIISNYLKYSRISTSYVIYILLKDDSLERLVIDCTY